MPLKPKMELYHYKEWMVCGRNVFTPPLKFSDNLSNEARIVHIVKGRSRLYSANHVWDLKTGDTLIMKSDNFINTWLENKDGSANKIIGFRLEASLLNAIYHGSLPAYFKNVVSNEHSPIEVVRENLIVDDYFGSLERYFDNPQYFDDEILASKIREVISILVQTDTTGTVRELFGSLFTSREYSFQKVVSQQLYQPLNLEDLAFLTNMSLSSFKRKFQDIYGTSPSKYFTAKRLERAQQLLKTTTMQVAEIALESGFNDISHFSKTFKKFYGVPPSELQPKSAQ